MRARTEMNKEILETMKRMRTTGIKVNERMQGIAPASSPYLGNEGKKVKKINQKESEVRTVMGGIFGRRNHLTNYRSQILNFKSQVSNLKSLRMALMAVLAVVVCLFSVPVFAYNAGDVIYVNATVSNYCPNGSQFDLIVTLTDFYGNPVTGLSSDNKNYGLILKNIRDINKNNVSYTGFVVNTQDTNAWTEIGNGQYKQTGTITSGTDPVYFDLEYRDPSNTNYKMKAAVMINRQGACSSTDPGILDSAPDYTYYPFPTGTVVIRARLKNQDGSAHTGANCPTGYNNANKWGGGTADTLYINNLKDVNNNNANSWSVTACTDNGDGTYDITLNYNVPNDQTIYLPELRYDYDANANIKMTTVAAFEVNSNQAPTNPTGTPPSNPGCPECTGPTDTTPPVEGTLSISPDDGTYTGPNFTITETFTDNESAVTSCEYTIDGGTTWNAGTVSGTGPYTCTANVTGATGTVTVQMRATSAGGTSTPVNTLSRTVDNTPPTDGTLTASPGNAQVSLSWTGFSDAESGLASSNTYRLVYDTAGTPADCNSGTLIYQGTATSYTHTGLTNGTTYYYRVCATDAMGNESAGATASATPQACSDPDPTTGVTVTPASGSTVSGTVTVQASIAGETTPGSGSATVTITGSTACNVSGAAMTWNAGTSKWEYSWNTSACGGTTPENGITISVDYTDPDCGDITTGTSNNITIDNTGPKYTVSSCSDCHDYPPTDATGGRNTPVGAVIGSHNIHVNQNGLVCTDCHIDNGTNLAHRNNQIDMVTIYGGTYSTTDPDFPAQDVEDGTGLGNCVNTNCHGSSSPKWGNNTTTPTCYKCHGTQANGNNAPPVDTNGDTAATDPQVGAHQAHLQATDNYSSPIACDECHIVPTNVFDTGHIDSALPAEITFGTLAKTNGANPSYTNGTCSNVYCHDETYFKNSWGSGTAPTWNDPNYLVGTSADCSKCHGYPPGGGHPVDSNCSSCHSHVNADNASFNDPTLHVDGLVEGGGDCISCHSKQQGNSRRNVSSDFTKTSHHVSTGMPTNVATCQACHGDLITDQGHPGSATTDPITQVEDADTAGTYYSIDPSTADANLATFCLSCHDANGASRLGANANKPFTDSGDNTAPPDVNTAWTNTFNHSAGATCKDCHGDNSAAGTTLDPKYNMHGSSNQKILREATEYNTCFQCHNTTINKTNLASEQDMDNNFNGGGVYQNNWNTIPNIQGQFATTNYAYHPLLGQGRNQPADNLNSNWTNSNYRKADNATACPDGTCTGLDNNFVDGWESTSLVTCTDCHNDSTGTVSGPHGSAQPWILKGIDRNVSVTTAGAGTIYPNQNAPNQPYINANFCVNCHRADIYGWGSKNSGYAINNETFSRLSHRGGAARTDCQATQNETGQGGYRNIGCMNCHGGGEVGGIHGSNLGVGTAGSDAMGKRFMNGNSWQGHTLGDASGSVFCYTGTPPAIGTNMSGCSGKHSGGKNVTPNYYYAWQ